MGVPNAQTPGGWRGCRRQRGRGLCFHHAPPMLWLGGAMGTWSSAPHLHWDFPPHHLPKTPLSLRLHRGGGWLPAGGGEAGDARLTPFRKRGPGARERVRGAWDEFSLLARLPGSRPWKCHWKL